MNVTTKPGIKMDMVYFAIETGAVYDGPQVVMASLEEAVQDGATWSLSFCIADDSRCMYERVMVVVTWPMIRACQNDTWTQTGVEQMAHRIMNQYAQSRYL